MVFFPSPYLTLQKSDQSAFSAVLVKSQGICWGREAASIAPGFGGKLEEAEQEVETSPGSEFLRGP